jgi:hypothetical protein
MRGRRDTVAVVVIRAFLIAVVLLVAALLGHETLLAKDGAAW